MVRSGLRVAYGAKLCFVPILVLGGISKLTDCTIEYVARNSGCAPRRHWCCFNSSAISRGAVISYEVEAKLVIRAPIIGRFSDLDLLRNITWGFGVRDVYRAAFNAIVVVVGNGKVAVLRLFNVVLVHVAFSIRLLQVVPYLGEVI